MKFHFFGCRLNGNGQISENLTVIILCFWLLFTENIYKLSSFKHSVYIDFFKIHIKLKVLAVKKQVIEL